MVDGGFIDSGTNKWGKAGTLYSLPVHIVQDPMREAYLLYGSRKDTAVMILRDDGVYILKPDPTAEPFNWHPKPNKPNKPEWLQKTLDKIRSMYR